jgi:hypothetical protein
MRTLLALVAVVIASAALAADEPISWEDADKHVGEEASVEGRVVAVHCSPLSCLLAFEPGFNRFTAVVQAASFDKLPPDQLEARFRGKDVRVTGKIQNRDGKPEIVVESPDAIALAGKHARRDGAGPPAERAGAEATADVMNRLADVLSRVEELTERMAAVQERMDAVLAQMEQREAALAASGPPPPLAEGDGSQRQAYETLRTVRRGMSRTDVQRLYGIPGSVDNGPGGWTTWYYSDGRSVSFDGRGRVQASVGFPAP